MTVKISSKGQIVIPKDLRKKYNLKPKSKVELVDTGEEIVVIPLPERDIFLNSKGILKGVGTKDLIKLRRKELLSERKKGRKI
jgi:AbrB family looped-hinge helix DNA binding protein